MQVTGYQRGGTLAAVISGELDHHTAAAARGGLDALITDDIKNIELDMSGLTFMDSSGIGVIVGRYKKIAARGGTFRVLNANEHIDRIMRMAGLYALLRRG